ncbi:MAG: conjugal transfer protein TraR [Melioribacteraceae bacterium]|nr:conjugal transfer protein TraR [Melioribacteraceae bacterium]
MAKKTVKKKSSGTTKKTTKAAEKKTTTKKTAANKKATSKKTAPKKAAEKKTTAKKSSTSKAKKTKQEVEILSPSKKLKKVKGYGKADLEEFKEIIMQKRNEIIEQLQSLKEQMMDPTTGQYVNESSPYSLHMAEQGTDAMEREKLYLWAQRENKFLTYLEEALQRIDSGTYGICIDCIDEPQNLCPTCPLVPKDRLKAVPHTQHCLQVKQKMQGR